jgi:pimeloyl-ACP methyl ester carboxylesterase
MLKRVQLPVSSLSSFPFAHAVKYRRILAVLVALLCIGAAVRHLEHAKDGLSITHTYAGQTPVTVFRPEGNAPAPVVVIAHGVAGSQQLMQPFAETLAHNGFIAVTFDFLGHGRNPEPMSGDVTKIQGGPTPLLVAELGRVAEFAQNLPGNDGRIAVLGHSMASDIVVRYAQAHPNVTATVAVSMFSPVVTPESPKNLAVIVGELESHLHDEARRVVGMVSGGEPAPGVIYGDFGKGTARRFTISPGVEHIGVLYSADSMAQARDWLDRAFGRTGNGYIEARGFSLALLFFGLTLLAWPLAGLLPRVSAPPEGAGLKWRKLLPVAVAPAILTPLILWQMPTHFLPILLGDYIALHFGLYGLLTLAGLWIATRNEPKTSFKISTNYTALVTAAALVAAYNILAFGFSFDSYVFSYLPIPERIPLIFALLAGTLPYFLADEWVTRGQGAARGGYAATKVLFLISLAIAVTLNLKKLFFLILIIPIILIFFVVYGLLSGWVNRRTGNPLVSGSANALAFAWAIAVTFPMIAL